MSSAADMGRYLAMYLNAGVLDGRRIVSRALLLAAPVLPGQTYAGAFLWRPDLTLVLLAIGALLVLTSAARIAPRYAPAAGIATPRRGSG